VFVKEFILEQAIEAATEVVNEEVFAPSKERAGLLISHAIAAPVDVAFEHICQLGLEGIVSKKLGSMCPVARHFGLKQ